MFTDFSNYHKITQLLIYAELVRNANCIDQNSTKK